MDFVSLNNLGLLFIPRLSDSGRFQFCVCVWFSCFHQCLFSHMELARGVIDPVHSARYLPRTRDPVLHFTTCSPFWYSDGFKAGRKGICLIYNLVRDDSDSAAAFFPYWITIGEDQQREKEAVKSQISRTGFRPSICAARRLFSLVPLEAVTS